MWNWNFPSIVRQLHSRSKKPEVNTAVRARMQFRWIHYTHITPPQYLCKTQGKISIKLLYIHIYVYICTWKPVTLPWHRYSPCVMVSHTRAIKLLCTPLRLWGTTAKKSSTASTANSKSSTFSCQLHANSLVIPATWQQLVHDTCKQAATRYGYYSTLLTNYRLSRHCTSNKAFPRPLATVTRDAKRTSSVIILWAALRKTAALIPFLSARCTRVFRVGNNTSIVMSFLGTILLRTQLKSVTFLKDQKGNDNLIFVTIHTSVSYGGYCHHRFISATLAPCGFE